MKLYVILRSVLIGGAVGTAFGIFIAPDNLMHALVFGNIGTWAGAITALLATFCLPGPRVYARQEVKRRTRYDSSRARAYDDHDEEES